MSKTVHDSKYAFSTFTVFFTNKHVQSSFSYVIDISVCSLINHYIDEQLDTLNCIDFRHREASADRGHLGLAEPSQNERSDERIWRVCVARAVSKPGRNIGLYPFVLGSSRRNRVYRHEACQLYRVLCNCHPLLLRRSKSSLPFSVVICAPDSDNVMSATA